MDETRFRDLLARHWTTLFDPHTIEKGADYLRRGYVLGTHYEEGDGEGALIGMVEGTARDPYASGVRLQLDGPRVRLDSYCSCPMQSDCKHVATQNGKRG